MYRSLSFFKKCYYFELVLKRIHFASPSSSLQVQGLKFIFFFSFFSNRFHQTMIGTNLVHNLTVPQVILHGCQIGKIDSLHGKSSPLSILVIFSVYIAKILLLWLWEFSRDYLKANKFIQAFNWKCNSSLKIIIFNHNF